MDTRKAARVAATTIVTLLVFAAAIATTSAAPPPQTKYIVFEGHVRNQRSGGPLVGVTLELHISPYIRSSQAVIADTTQTDASGAFHLRQHLQ